MGDWNTRIIEEFRANGGKVAAFSWATLLLLTTTGAKSGKPHTTPIIYLSDEDRLIISATANGAPTHPAWYHNLLAQPKATVEVGDVRREMTAVITMGEERERLWGKTVARYPSFADYQRKTPRQIPVIVLQPLS
jgi:deazaflavin-dependent oxidoreductase (nitroreductase family)